MAKKTISVEIENSGYDLIQQVSKFLKLVKDAGPFTAAAIPAEIAAAVAEFPQITADIGAISGDIKEDELEFIKGINIGAYDLFAALKPAPKA